jgi:hypothetical protein
MTAPTERKTVQVSADVHALLFERATELDTTAEGVLRRLLDTSTVHIPCTPAQRQRWQLAADATGVRLEEWLSLQTELNLQRPETADSHTIRQIFYRVDALCQHAGVVPPASARRPLNTRPLRQEE